MTTPGQRSARFPFMAVAMIALLSGVAAGLLRLGWAMDLPRPAFVSDHGPLMVCGFVGTLIGVERAVALGRPWAYAGPSLSAIGALVLIAGLPELLGAGFMTAASACLIAVFSVFLHRQLNLPMGVMALGALSWLAGNVLWLGGWPLFTPAAWWIGFLVLTIAGERLDLSRLLRPSRWSQLLFATLVGVLLAGLVSGGVSDEPGVRICGLALVALTFWLLQYDIARRTVRQTGLKRFTAICLLSGYFWLATSGLIALGLGPGGRQYDAILHGVFLGFVMSMIFGHAPIIFPAILGIAVPFRTAFYLHLILLHASLALRVVGDLFSLWALREWGGLFNALALLLFLGNTAHAVLQRES